MYSNNETNQQREMAASVIVHAWRGPDDVSLVILFNCVFIHVAVSPPCILCIDRHTESTSVPRDYIFHVPHFDRSTDD